MTMTTLSVIIPVYNTEEYLSQSLDSIINQNFESMEILIIDDGSTDNSLDIIRYYSEKYAYIHFVSQKNKGQGVARNLGISKAKGKYIYFMDSDDILEPGTFNSILPLMIEKNLDLLMFDGESFVDGIQDFDEGLMNAYTRQKSYGFFENGQELFYELSVAREYTVQPCLYVTKLEFLQRNNILFGEGFIHEDEIFTLLVLLNAKRCLHINKPYFMRRLRPGSTMTENNKVKKYYGYYQVFLAFNHIYKDFHFVNIKYKKRFTSHISYIFRKLITQYQEREVSNVDDLFIEIKRFGKNNKGYDVAGFICLYFYRIYSCIQDSRARLYK